MALGIYLFGKETPWSLAHPVKIMGNLGGLILVLGSGYALWRRISPLPNKGKNAYADWLFLYSVFLTGLSGLLTEGLRLVNLANLAYPMYFLHLTFVWYLFLSLPFSKFAHAMYRTLAILYARSAGKDFQGGRM